MPTKNTKTTIKLERQLASKNSLVPSSTQMKNWVRASLEEIAYTKPEAELTIRVVDKKESQALNSRYRAKNKPTNVLSFVDQPIPGFESDYLGDLVICAELVAEEATSQEISIEDHWAHLIVHGVLHLFNYDHVEDEEAEIMEALEIKILEKLGVANPYEQ